MSELQRQISYIKKMYSDEELKAKFRERSDEELFEVIGRLAYPFADAPPVAFVWQGYELLLGVQK